MSARNCRKLASALLLTSVLFLARVGLHATINTDVLASMPAVAGLVLDDCPPELFGGCGQCYMTAHGYVYYGCPEDCGFNESLCDSWCGGYDECYEQGGNQTCGECTCGMRPAHAIRC